MFTQKKNRQTPTIKHQKKKKELGGDNNNFKALI